MTVLNRLASALNRSDQQPNIELAAHIAEAGDVQAVADLVRGLLFGKKPTQHDCIKVLYEIGERRPQLIADYSDQFAGLLQQKNNRLQWGAMSALSSISGEHPEWVVEHLDKIIVAADRGSVITRDHAVKILVRLCTLNSFSEEAWSLLISQLGRCPTNQLPMYAEWASAVIPPPERPQFINTLESRLTEIDKLPKRKRIEKVIRSVNKQS